MTAPINLIRTKLLPASLFLYSIAILTTMAGMEIFGWLTFLLISIVAIFDRKKGVWILRRPLLETGDWALLSLMTVIILSAFIAAPQEADKLFIVGNARFVMLFLGMRFSLEAVTDRAGAPAVEKAFRFLLVLIGVTSIYAISQHFNGIDYIRGHRDPITKYVFQGGSTFRSRGMWGHPVTFGHSMALSFSMIFGYAVSRNKFDKWKAIGIGVSVLSATAILWSYTRGAWIAIAAAVAIMVLFLGRKIAISVYSGSVALLVGAFFASEEFRQRLASVVSTTDLSNVQRIDIWKANIAMFKDHPIFGVGYGFNEDLITAYYEKLGITQEFGGHAHNNYLQFLSGTGILGFAAYTAFTGIFLWMSIKLLRTVKKGTATYGLVLGALGAQVALLVGGLTECNFKDAEVNHQFMFICALVMLIWRANSLDTNSRANLGRA
ncbi:hypothetical protein BH10BDE1_BH10BDE1_36030 [soil metagenome]